MASNVRSTRSKRSRQVAGAILAFIVLVVMVLANLPYQYVQAEGHWLGMAQNDSVGTYQPFLVLPKMAGWPLDYWVQYQQDWQTQDRYWSTWKLIANGVIAIALASLVYGFIQLRHVAASKSARARLLSDVGLALVILLLPGLVFGWEFMVSSKHQRLARRLSRYGNVHLACWLPKPIADHVPNTWKRSLTRVRKVYVVDMPDAMARRVVEIPSLISLHSYRCGYDLSVLEELTDRVHFSVLRINQCEVTEADIDVISRMRWLAQLDLSQTNLEADMLARCELSNLRSVNVALTPLVLSEFSRPPWADTVEDLTLPRPPNGSSASLKIEGWKRLERLTVQRFSNRWNDGVLELELSDLPELELLAINRVQKHRLTLRNLPRLAMIEEGLSDSRFMQLFSGKLPGLTWVDELVLDGVPSLTTFGCYAKDLETISIGDAPHLRSLAIGSFTMSPTGDQSGQSADAIRCQTWIEQLGTRQGPGTVDLTMLPLDDVDLTPLSGNRRIRHLRLGYTGVTFEQVQGLAGMEQLETLEIPSCRLQRDELSWVLQQFPNLRSLDIDSSDLTNLSLNETQKLRRLRTTQFHKIRDMRIVDVPSLNTQIRLVSAPQSLEIRNARSLLGLAVDEPWPTDASVEGLRDLQWFTGGGHAIDNALMDVLLDCRGIDQLTLAYTSITKDRLREVGRFRDLTMLAIPGTTVDDDVTDQWKELKLLWEINLDDSRVSVRTLAWLSRIESLRRVSLNRVSFSDAAAEALGELTQISELQLAGASLNTKQLSPLLSAGNLESLDVSGCTLDDEVLKLLGSAHTLKNLVVHNVDIEPFALRMLLDSNPSLYVDFGTLPEFVGERTETELRKRGEEARYRLASGWRELISAQIETRGLGKPDEVKNEDPRQMVSLSLGALAGRVDPRVYRSSTVD